MAAKKKPEKWIQKADIRPGKFTDWAKAHGFRGVSEAAIAAGKKSKSAAVRKEADLAETFKHMNHKKGKKK